jgi:hypothetical protein
MRRNVLLATSVLLWAGAGWSGVYQTDASENLCRADQEDAESGLASLPASEEEPSDKPPRERVFGAPVSVLSKRVIEAARELLDYPMGSEYIIEVNGTPYGFRLEPHYHPPGFQSGPIGWHKGVTVYEIEERDSR